MLGFYNSMAWSAGTLLVIAAAIALWERWRQHKLPRAVSLLRSNHAVSVDVVVDALPETSAGDRLRRTSTYDAAMDRMASGPLSPPPPAPTPAWIETCPMVIMGSAVEPGNH